MVPVLVPVDGEKPIHRINIFTQVKLLKQGRTTCQKEGGATGERQEVGERDRSVLQGRLEASDAAERVCVLADVVVVAALKPPTVRWCGGISPVADTCLSWDGGAQEVCQPSWKSALINFTVVCAQRDLQGFGVK